MGDCCIDNRFEVIERAKQHILESTNIESRQEECDVLDSFLYRCWQMGWLKDYDDENKQICDREWKNWVVEKPLELEEVIGFNPLWINEYNPTGVRTGYLDSTGYFISIDMDEEGFQLRDPYEDENDGCWDHTEDKKAPKSYYNPTYWINKPRTNF